LIGSSGNIQDGLPSGTDDVTSGPIAVTALQTPALVLSVAMNTTGGSSDTGGSGYGGPVSGSGFTQITQMWDWGVNLATFESAIITTPGNAAALYSNAPDTANDSYVTVAAAFLPASSPALPSVGIGVAQPQVPDGQSDTLTWSSANATSCTASGAWSGAVATAGSLAVTPAVTSTYTLTCANANGSSTPSSATVYVIPSPPVGQPPCADACPPPPTPPATATSSPQLLQIAAAQSITGAGSSDGNSSVAFTTPTRAGNTIWLAVATERTSTPAITVSDSQGNVYHRLDQRNDGAPGFLTVAHFYAAHIAGDGSTPNTVTVHVRNDRRRELVVAEIAGTAATPVVSHAARRQNRTASDGGSISTGSLAVPAGSAPALVLALCMNANGALDPPSSGSPAAGPGYTEVGQFWAGSLRATLETGNLTSPGDAIATFRALDVNPYVTLAAVFH
jgi:hypothetical protein